MISSLACAIKKDSTKTPKVIKVGWSRILNQVSVYHR